MQTNAPFHSLSPDAALAALDCTAGGLTAAEAARRLARFGCNEISEKERTPAWKQLLGQFANFLIMTLVIASVISAAMGEVVEAVSIIIIVVLAGVLGFVQEHQAEKAIAALKKMAAPRALVLRDGVEQPLESRLLVPGDIIILKTGDTIPADARLLETAALKLEESALTGESQGVEKTVTAALAPDCAIGDRLTMVYAGTSISGGRGRALVTATGDTTEFGKIAAMLQAEPDKKTPLQTNLDSLGSKLGLFALVLAVLVSAAGVFRGYELVKMFIWGVALAVAVIPEALPAVVTISLALGVRRMVRRRALVRKLPAVETLGAVNIICSDKTGTLTQDQMTVRKIHLDGKTVDVGGSGYDPAGKLELDGSTFPADDPVLTRFLLAGSLCNDSRLRQDGGGWTITGDPTEGALVVLAAKAGMDSDLLRTEHPRLGEDPFTSEKKRMTTYHRSGNALLACCKGAGEIILANSSHMLTAAGPVPLTAELRASLKKTIEAFAEQSLRVIGVASKEKPADSLPEAETGLTLLGFAGMIDPPRPEVAAAIRKCEQAGIKPVMITGDHKITAVAIARELGILKQGRALSGEEIEQMSDDEFKSIVGGTEVFARISPAHKHKIVDALMAQGNVVAMTGDGVNDAPTLKKANIGIAMGITGTDVTKEAGDMILTDDNFASIVSAVEEGRTIFENIRKYLVYLLSGNMGTVFAIVAAMVAGLALPLTAVQILFINFVMDGLVAIALGVEKPEPGIMRRRPRNVREGILDRRIILEIGLIGLVIGGITMTVFVQALAHGAEPARAGTMFFTALVFARLVNGLTCRSLDRSLFRLNPLSNPALVGSIAVTAAMVVFMVATPALHRVFGLVSLTAAEWQLALLLPLSLVLFSELLKLGKWLRRKGRRLSQMQA